jgi:uncharacterized metal-binding protein
VEIMSNSCACNAALTLIFACSGAADVGALADQAARRLTREGAGNMFCLAGIGGRVSGIVKSTEAAAKILVIDGRPLDCARKCLEQAGILEFQHLQLAGLGFRKGQSPVDETAIQRVAEAGREKLAALCCS